MNAISMWPASRFAHSLTVSDIRRRKFERISIRKMSGTHRAGDAAGHEALQVPERAVVPDPLVVESTKTLSARISGNPTLVSAA